MQEESEADAVRDLFAVSKSEAAAAAPAGGAAAVATSCDVNLLDLIGEDEHKEFGEKLAKKMADMSTGPYIVAMITELLAHLEPKLDEGDYQVGIGTGRKNTQQNKSNPSTIWLMFFFLRATNEYRSSSSQTFFLALCCFSTFDAQQIGKKANVMQNQKRMKSKEAQKKAKKKESKKVGTSGEWNGNHNFGSCSRLRRD